MPRKNRYALDPEVKYPLKPETQFLRLALEESEDRYRRLVHRVILGAIIALIFGIVMTGNTYLTVHKFNDTILRMTEEHAKAIKTAVNAQARQVKYGNEGR